MSGEECRKSIAEMKEELDILQKWFREKENEDRRHGWRIRKWVKWNLLQQKWNAMLMNKLEKIHIALLEEGHSSFCKQEAVSHMPSKF